VITLFHDHASPGSAVAVLRLHALADEGLPVRIVGYQPMPMEVAIPPSLAVLEELERHRDQARALGLELRRPQRLPPTTGAHLVERLADEPPVARRFRELAYRALWEDGADIADRDVLGELADRAGIARAMAVARLGDRVEVARTKQHLAAARSAHIGGVPALDVDGTLVSAFLPLDHLRELAAL